MGHVGRETGMEQMRKVRKWAGNMLVAESRLFRSPFFKKSLTVIFLRRGYYYYVLVPSSLVVI